MNETFNKQIIYTIVRQIVQNVAGVTIGAWLVTHGILTTTQVEWLVGGIAAGLIVIGTALKNKYHLQEKICVALGLPSGSTTEDLKKAMSKVRE